MKRIVAIAVVVGLGLGGLAAPSAWADPQFNPCKNLPSWSALKNGDLLRAAERDGFDVFVTGDTTLVLEQNLTSRRLAIVTLSTNNWPIIKDKVPEILGAINLATPGSFVTVECGRFSRKR